MTEYRIEHPGPRFPVGRFVLKVANRGHLDHQLTLFRIPDEAKGTIDEILRTDVHKFSPQYTLTPILRPHGRTSFATDLAPGRYAMVCLLPGPGGTIHALQGMSSELEVG